MFQMLRRDLPLKERVLRSPGHAFQPPTLYSRPGKYRTWADNDQKLNRAVESVIGGQFSLRRAAKEFNVPRSTLHDHITGKVVSTGHGGQPKYLTIAEEEELEEFLVGCASVGFARSRQQVLQLVQEVVNRKEYNVQVSHGWWESFRRRHPNLSLRTASPLSYARVVGSDPNIIGRYFDLLERTLTDNSLVEKPSQIFNLDETGMPLNPAPPRLVAARGMQNPSAIGSGDKSQITACMLQCGGLRIAPICHT